MSVKDSPSATVSGAKGDGYTDDTAAIQATINRCPASGCTVLFPAGTYKITSPIVVSRDRIDIVGQGRGATMILFAPNQPGPAILVSRPFNCGYNVPCADIVQNSIRNLSIFSNDTINQKVGIKIVAASQVEIEDVAISGAGPGSSWSGGMPSIGVQVQGHENSSLSKLYINADEPISIETNPLVYGTMHIDIDHFHFSDLYLIAGSYPCVKIGDPVILTQVIFDGREAWVGGTHGLYWNAASGSAASEGLFLSNVRTEQGTNPSAYSIWISASGRQIQNVMISGMYGDPNRNLAYLRGTFWTSIQNMIYGGKRVALDADSSNYQLAVHNSFFQIGSTVGSTTSIKPTSNGSVNTTP